MRERLRALNPLSEDLNSLILSRFFVFLLLTGTCLLFLWHDTFVYYLLVAYSISVAVFVLGVSLGRNLLRLSSIKLFLLFHVILELGIEAAIVKHSGGIDSPFALFFVLSIASAGLICQLKGSMLAAATGSVFYLFVVLGSSFERAIAFPTLSNLARFYGSSSADFSTLALNIFIFLIIAFNVGYMAEKLHRKTRELSLTSDELRHTRLETEEIIEQMHSGLVSIDAQGRIVHFNRSAEAILGLGRQQAKERHYSEVLTGGLLSLGELVADSLERQLCQERTEIRIAREGKREIPLGLSITPFLDEGKVFGGLVVQFTDLTRVKMLEERVRLGDRLAAVGQLSASIAHEIRNPLAAISGSVQVLSSELDLSGQNQRLMELVLKESARLNQVLSGILRYSGIQVATQEEVKLFPLLEEVFAIAREHPSYRPKISCRIEFEDPELRILGEENQVKQLFLNLVLNSQQAFGPEGGEIRITEGMVDTGFKYQPSSPFEDRLKKMDRSEERDLIEANNLCAVNVIDSGEGIPEEILNKLFQPFYTTKSEGTGLGLAVVQRLAESLQAHLSLYSATGGGTIFTVYLKNCGRRAEPPPKPERRLAGETIPS
ncbi:MAG: nitrogen regulation protein NR(II) [Candidatus Zixiibacteriota bacterium]